MSLGALLGVLVAFAIWSLAWCLDGRIDRVYGISSSPVSVIMSDSNYPTDAPNARQILTSVLKKEGVALIIDGMGSGYPGLEVMDPNGKIPWLPNQLDQMLAKDKTSVFLFRDTYCENTWQATHHCPLLPPNSQVVAVISAPQGVTDAQYAYIATSDSEIHANRYVFSHTIEDFDVKLQPFLDASGFVPNSILAPSVLQELANNPLVILAWTLLLLGTLILFIYWKNASTLLKKSYKTRISCGATPSKLVRDQIRASLLPLSAGIILGTFSSVPIVILFSNADIEPEVFAWLSLACMIGTLFGVISLYISFSWGFRSIRLEA